MTLNAKFEMDTSGFILPFLIDQSKYYQSKILLEKAYKLFLIRVYK